MPRTSRKPEILQALAHMLEANPGGKITTAACNRSGPSGAALYRHFPSKAKMIEGLIEFIEETLFSRMAAIANEPRDHEDSAGHLTACPDLCGTQPGFARLFVGDALQGETDRLRARMRNCWMNRNPTATNPSRSQPTKRPVTGQSACRACQCLGLNRRPNRTICPQ